MNEFFKFFQNKYSFSKEDLIQIYDKDYKNFYEMMKNRNLINPTTTSNLYIMEKEIDKFMEEMTYSNKRRRR
jgi:hypothetical protein